MNIKINEFAGTAVQDQQNVISINNGTGTFLIDYTGETLKPGTSYLVTISLVQSTPDIVVQTEGDPTEEHI